MSDVTEITENTRLDVEPDKILDAAKGEMKELVICGYNSAGELYVASSKADTDLIIALLSRALKLTLEQE